MITNSKINNLICLAVFVLSQSALAANAVRVDAKKLLNIEPGVYKVVTATPADEDDSICTKNLEHRVQWGGSSEVPVLAFGVARIFSGFNNGLSTEALSEGKNACKLQHSTQAEPSRLIDDSFMNCLGENTTTHVEIAFKGSQIFYSAQQKISRKGKVVSISSKCELKLLKP